VGLDTSCAILIVVNSDRSLTVLDDFSQPPFDGGDDTLVGVQNNSNQPLLSLGLASGTPVFGFDGDGICDSFPEPPGCPFGPTGYEGPGVSFTIFNFSSGTIDFNGGIPPGGSVYFSLEGAISAQDLSLTSCGNGVVEGREECDDGNPIDGDGCDSNCTSTACGNGILTAGEECDDGNRDDADCCSSSCTVASDGTACDDGLFCDGTDTCVSGACTVHTGDPCIGGTECNNACDELRDVCFTAAGIHCTDDGNVCTSDQCDGNGAGVHLNNDFALCNDGVFCNGGDLCLGGSCSFHLGDPCALEECADRCDEVNAVCIPSTSGTQCFDDGNVCTDDDCDGFGSCVHPPKSSGAPCFEDGDVCTKDQCDGAGSCTHPPAADGTVCDDANLCTQTDRCQAGHCVGSNPVFCPAPPCHQGTCEPSSGICTNCPTGYTPGDGGCQKTYAIDASQLDNLNGFCGNEGRENDCSRPFGFHWTDTGDSRVGAVARMDVRIGAGIDCSATGHHVTLNGSSIGAYPFAHACFCFPDATLAPQVLVNVDTSAYVKGELNAIAIDGTGCTGLTREENGHFATVTVTYADPGFPVAIHAGCRQAMKSKLKYRNRTDDAEDELQWKWFRGGATTRDEFADPTESADYEFCVYAEADDSPALLLEAGVPSSMTLWSAAGRQGFKYKDPAASHDGINRILVRGGIAGKSKVIVKGKGTLLGDPTRPSSPATGIRVQLTNEATGVCWESEFPVSEVGGTISVSAP